MLEIECIILHYASLCNHVFRCSVANAMLYVLVRKNYIVSIVHVTRQCCAALVFERRARVRCRDSTVTLLPFELETHLKRNCAAFISSPNKNIIIYPSLPIGNIPRDENRAREGHARAR